MHITINVIIPSQNLKAQVNGDAWEIFLPLKQTQQHQRSHLTFLFIEGKIALIRHVMTSDANHKRTS